MSRTQETEHAPRGRGRTRRGAAASALGRERLRAIFGLAVVGRRGLVCVAPGCGAADSPPAAPAPDAAGGEIAPPLGTRLPPPAAPQTPPVDSSSRAETEPDRQQEPSRTDLSAGPWSFRRAVQGRVGPHRRDITWSKSGRGRSGWPASEAAAYFNPRPIHVSQASATQEGGPRATRSSSSSRHRPTRLHPTRLGYRSATDSSKGSLLPERRMLAAYESRLIFVRLP